MKKSIGAKEIGFPNPVYIVCTYDDEGKANAMNVAWAGMMGGKNPTVAISIRPGRYSHNNLVNRKAFTMCIPSQEYMQEADYLGMASGRNENKLEKVGLTVDKSENVDAPYIKEFPYIMECEITQNVDLESHTLFIAEIKDIKIDEDKMIDDNSPDWDKIKPFAYDHAHSDYREVGDVVGKAFSAGKKFMK